MYKTESSSWLDDLVPDWPYEDGDLGEVSYSRDIALLREKFYEARAMVVKRNSHPTASKSFGTFTFNDGDPDEFVVDEMDDVFNALNLVWDTFQNDFAVKLAQYYSHQFFLYSGDSFGDTKGGVTHITLTLIYKHMKDEHVNDFPETDYTDANQRAVFISSIMFHEFLHSFHGSLSSAETIRAEAAVWGATYWYLTQLGGHDYLKEWAYSLITEKEDWNVDDRGSRHPWTGVYAPGKQLFDVFLYRLAGRPARLTDYTVFKAMFHKPHNLDDVPKLITEIGHGVSGMLPDILNQYGTPGPW